LTSTPTTSETVPNANKPLTIARPIPAPAPVMMLRDSEKSDCCLRCRVGLYCSYLHYFTIAFAIVSIHGCRLHCV
jgi:hypothetical protein